jgi:hypothetical protein
MLNYTENLNIRVLKDTIYITSSDFTEIKRLIITHLTINLIMNQTT